MKKLLTVLAITLALVLACTSLALATDVGTEDDSTFGGMSYEDATRIHEYKDPATGELHEVSNPRVMRESTCVQKGVIRFDCDTDPSHFHEVFMPLAEHTWGEWEGNCTEKQTRKCKVCGKVEEAKALGHDWASNHADKNKNWGKVTKDPTCMEEGEAIDYCLRCGEINPDIQPRKIEKLDHDFSKFVVDEEPSCKGPGKGHYECAYECGTVQTDATGAVVYVEIPLVVEEGKDGHDWDEWVTMKEATCYEAGNMIRWCKRCGEKQEKVLPALEAKYEAVKELDRLIDCYTLERTYRCSICGSKADKNGVIAHPEYTSDPLEAVVAHHFKYEKDYILEEVKPTCEEDGYIIYKCVWYDEDADRHAADEKATDKVIVEKLGHDWDKWEERVAPGKGDNEYGYYLRECKRCHKTEEKISKTFPADGETVVPEEPVKNGLVEEDGKLHLYVDGEPSSANGLTYCEADDNWYMLSGGYVDQDFTDLAYKFGNWWTVENGKLVNRDADDLVTFNGKQYMVSGGMVWTTWSGIHWHKDGKPYFLNRGEWDPSYSGVIYQDNHAILVTGGMMDLEATTYNGKAVVNGIIQD